MRLYELCDSHRLLFNVLLVTAVIGCGGDAENQNIDEVITGRVAEATGAEPSTDREPCEILSDELIRRHFDIADAEITRTPSRYSPHPLCTASWPKPNAAEIEEMRAEQMAEHMMKKMQGEDVEKASLRSTDEVSLTLSKEVFRSREQVLAAFDSAMRVMSEGMTVETDAGAVESPRYELEPVSGVGQKAMWAPKLHQLSVAATDRILHVGVRTQGGPERELQKAKALAREIMETL